MSDTEILRRRIASLLTEIEELPPPTAIIDMSPENRANLVTSSWDLRSRWYFLDRDIDYQSQVNERREDWKKVAEASSSVNVALKRYDRTLVELLAITRQSLTDLTEAVRKAEKIASRTYPSPIFTKR